MQSHDDQLAGYLLNALDEDARREVEAHLRSHPDARRKLDTLSAVLSPLEADRDDPEPPPGLAERTLALVAQHSKPKLPPSPRLTSRWGFSPSRWRRSDLLVASVAALILLGMGSVWIGKARTRADETQCKNNLGTFYKSLAQYASNRSDAAFPRVEKEGPRSFAGVVVPTMIEAGLMKPDSVPVCPAHAGWKPPTEMTRLADVEKCYKENRERFDDLVSSMSGCYAYSLGYLWENGVRGLRLGTEQNKVPIMGDAPPFRGRYGAVVGNSLSHGGRGQNVLYTDGSVRFVTTRALDSDDDIFLNRYQRIQTGVNQVDCVLGAGNASP